MCGLIQGLSVTTAIVQGIYLIIYHVLWIKMIIGENNKSEVILVLG